MSILALTSNTLVGTPAAGNLEYNGQFFGTDSAGSRAQLQRIASGTAVASTSGTSIDFTGIPSWVKRITVMFSGFSTNGSSKPRIQLGDSGGVETTGYAGSNSAIGSSSANSASSTGGFDFNTVGTTAAILGGSAVFSLLNASTNTWVCNAALMDTVGYSSLTGGSKSLSDTLTQVRITTVNGTDAFDAGSINILYEG